MYTSNMCSFFDDMQNESSCWGQFVDIESEPELGQLGVENQEETRADEEPACPQQDPVVEETTFIQQVVVSSADPTPVSCISRQCGNSNSNVCTTSSSKVSRKMSIFGKRRHEVKPLQIEDSGRDVLKCPKAESPESEPPVYPLERILKFLIQMHPKAGSDEVAAERLRKQFLKASPQKQQGVFRAAVSAARKQGRGDLLSWLEGQDAE